MESENRPVKSTGDSVTLRDYTPAHRPPLTIPSKQLWGRLDVACYLLAAPWVFASLWTLVHWYPLLLGLMSGQSATFVATLIVAGPAIYIGYVLHSRDIQIRDVIRIIANSIGTIYTLTAPGRTSTGPIKDEPRQRINNQIYVLQDTRRNSGRELR